MILQPGIARQSKFSKSDRRENPSVNNPPSFKKCSTGLSICPHITVPRRHLHYHHTLLGTLFLHCAAFLTESLLNATPTKTPLHPSSAFSTGKLPGALITSLFIANQLFARIGVMASILLFQAVYVIGFGALIFAPAFVIVVVFRFLQMLCSPALPTRHGKPCSTLSPTKNATKCAPSWAAFPNKRACSLPAAFVLNFIQRRR